MKKLLLVSAFAFGLISSANAAVTTNAIVSAQTPKEGHYQFTSASSTATYQTVYTAGSNGSKCFAATVTNTDISATHVVTLSLNDGTNTIQLAGITTVSPSATTLPVSQNIWAGAVVGLPVDGNANSFVYLNSGDTLKAQFATAITSSDFVNVIAICQDF